MKTSYPGLDYSGPASTVNRDPVTGIRYGIISLRSLGEFAFEDIEQHGIDQDFEEFQQRIKAEIDSALRPVLKDYVLSSRIDKLIENAQDDALEEASDCYQQPSDWVRYHYERDGYVLQVTGDGNLFVIKSPFVTNAQYCSPCVPGAGNLDSPCDSGPECYALGLDWFDEKNPCPYDPRPIASKPA
jgi:hypothetical protein